MIAYAGSFVLMEETSEKTEKTEKSEEAIHSLYHSKNFGKSIVKGITQEVHIPSQVHFATAETPTAYYLPVDFNIHFIYYTSFLELSCQATILT